MLEYIYIYIYIYIEILFIFSDSVLPYAMMRCVLSLPGIYFNFILIFCLYSPYFCVPYRYR